ncbi:GNAT family N-acetyltransferase [Methylobacterium terricola]|uniref:GNAT family N-acetyltransferase n=1 Tax=Methylobacterium terricola TaxID=2583531 RepID=A0A5C4LSR4_9HYPH|nr:GNAT family N-acetyltransferase [Methylobacterium terricola]TNC16047.1 GNAT family N-acetyltransferase [Methylobacterium terricola]
MRWRPLRAPDLPAASHLAARIHPDYPEDDAVMAERLSLCPEGCFALAAEDGLVGYAVGHPWRARSVPDLDTLVGALPEPAEAWCIHDVALDPRARGRGAAAAIVGLMLGEAARRRLPEAVLVAVGDAAGFWRRHGFQAVPQAAPPGYGARAALMVRAVPDPS